MSACSLHLDPGLIKKTNYGPVKVSDIAVSRIFPQTQALNRFCDEDLVYYGPSLMLYKEVENGINLYRNPVHDKDTLICFEALRGDGMVRQYGFAIMYTYVVVSIFHSLGTTVPGQSAWATHSQRDKNHANCPLPP